MSRTTTNEFGEVVPKRLGFFRRTMAIGTGVVTGLGAALVLVNTVFNGVGAPSAQQRSVEPGDLGDVGTSQINNAPKAPESNAVQATTTSTIAPSPAQPIASPGVAQQSFKGPTFEGAFFIGNVDGTPKLQLVVSDPSHIGDPAHAVTSVELYADNRLLDRSETFDSSMTTMTETPCSVLPPGEVPIKAVVTTQDGQAAVIESKTTVVRDQGCIGL